MEGLPLRLASENPRRSYGRLQRELVKLGHTLGRSTIRDVLKRRHVPLTPLRSRHTDTWREFLGRHRDTLLTCGFFTVDTLFLKTLPVLFFLEIGTRDVHIAACIAHPPAARVAQQARNPTYALQDDGCRLRFLSHDRDTKYPSAFDAYSPPRAATSSVRHPGLRKAT